MNPKHRTWGRPPKSAEKKQTITLRFRIAAMDWAWIRTAAAGMNLPMAEYIRRRALGLPLPSVTGLNHLLAIQLSRVNSNLTQLHQALQRGAIHPFPERELTDLAGKTKRVRHALLVVPDPKPVVHALALSKKNKMIKLTVTRSVHQGIKERAREHRMHLSGFLRHVGLNTPPAQKPKDIGLFFDELSRAQWNLNLMTHAINAGIVKVINPEVIHDLDKLFTRVFDWLEAP